MSTIYPAYNSSGCYKIILNELFKYSEKHKMGDYTMIFNYVAGIEEVNSENVKINHREAVRAVIFKDHKLLMVSTNKGDYKFPGGGTNKGESHKDTLIREVKEETGYAVSELKQKLGGFTERKLDEYEENSIFEMISHYYLCEVADSIVTQQLDDYENDLDFSPVWVTLDEAIYLNEKSLKNENKNPWAYREIKVLRALKECNIK